MKEHLRAQGLPCWICHQSIDYDAPWNAPTAFAVDHVLPLSAHPELAEEWANLRASHRGCNGSKGDGPPPAGLGRTSREW